VKVATTKPMTSAITTTGMTGLPAISAMTRPKGVRR
jgi:hypothetical protein